MASCNGKSGLLSLKRRFQSEFRHKAGWLKENKPNIKATPPSQKIAAREDVTKIELFELQYLTRSRG